MAEWKAIAHGGDTRWVTADAWPAAVQLAAAAHEWPQAVRDRLRSTIRNDGTTIISDPDFPGRIIELSCEDAAPPTLYEDVQPRMVRFEPLLVGAAGAADACHRVVIGLEQHVAADSASALLPRNDRLEFVVARGPAAAKVRSFLLRLDAGIAGYVYQTGRPVVVDDLGNHHKHLKGIAEAIGYAPRALLAVPIMDQSLRVRGVIELLRDKQPFATDDLVHGRAAGLALGEWLAMRGE